MKKVLLKTFLLALIVCWLSGCKDPTPEPESPPPTPIAKSALAEEVTVAPDDSQAEWISCPEQRPEMCAQIYLPVCGAEDTGIRCITTPCPSSRYKTFGNACTACAEASVSQYREGECKNENTVKESEEN